MKTIIHWTIIIAITISTVSLCAEAGRKDNRQPLTFCNPLNIEYRFTPGKPSRRMAADPVIVLFKDTYFLFSTGSSEYWYSSDLVDWTLIPEEKSELPDNPTAPAVTVVGEEVYFIPSSRRTGLFYKSTDPKSGKWELAKKSIGTWDPALFCDDDGRTYYYFGCSNRAPIQGVELDKSSMKPKGEIKDFFKGNKEEHGWERRGDKHELPNPAWIEGPWMTKHADTYYLQYAAPGTEFKSYADGIYTSKNPLGPFKYEPYSPFSHKPGGFIGGAGHGATFRDKYGNFWRVTTMVISVLDMFERRVGIFPAGFDKDGVMYTNTLLGDFPQIMPEKKRDPFANNLAQWLLLSYAKKADASSSISGHGTRLAFDENVKTWWCAKTSNKGEWLKVDLGKMCVVNAVQVNFAEHEVNLHGREKPIYHQYILEYSNDDQNWKKLVDKSRNAKDVPHDYIRLPQPVKTRFIKLINIHTPGDGPFAVRDLRLFGNGLGKAPQQVNGLSVDRDSSDRRTANITWNKSKDAAGYVIRYGITPRKLYNQYQVMGKTELKINSLNRDVGYYFSVDVFNENGYTKGTDIIDSN
jgi:beta-xylosidase